MAFYNYRSGGSSKTEKETKQRCTADNAYDSSFIDIWSKTFGHKYLMERKEWLKIRTAMGVFSNEVLYNRGSVIKTKKS